MIMCGERGGVERHETRCSEREGVVKDKVW